VTSESCKNGRKHIVGVCNSGNMKSKCFVIQKRLNLLDYEIKEKSETIQAYLVS
jgi:hypothetical protein